MYIYIRIIIYVHILGDRLALECIHELCCEFDVPECIME